MEDINLENLKAKLETTTNLEKNLIQNYKASEAYSRLHVEMTKEKNSIRKNFDVWQNKIKSDLLNLELNKGSGKIRLINCLLDNFQNSKEVPSSLIIGDAKNKKLEIKGIAFVDFEKAVRFKNGYKNFCKKIKEQGKKPLPVVGQVKEFCLPEYDQLEKVFVYYEDLSEKQQDELRALGFEIESAKITEMEIAALIDKTINRDTDPQKKRLQDDELARQARLKKSLESVPEKIDPDVSNKIIIRRKRDEQAESQRRELLEKFNVHDFVKWFRQCEPNDFEYDNILKNPLFLKGYVFEYLVNSEMNEDEESSLLGAFVIKCLKNPGLLGLERSALRNPDHLGVVIDSAKAKAYITGMYEVKMGALVGRAREQLENFYQNVDWIVRKINSNLGYLVKKFDFIPPKGIQLEKFNDIYKFLVAPQAEDAKEERVNREKRAALETEFKWQLKVSVFPYKAMEDLAKFISQSFDKQPADKSN
jgi:hypothetical protein